MKTELIFFGDEHTSMKGMIRGAVALTIVLLFGSIIYKTYAKAFTFSPIWISIIGTIIASAISVQNPKTFKEAIVYGSLVGFVIYGVVAMSLLMVKNVKWTILDAAVVLAMGTASSMAAAAILYIIPGFQY